MLASYFSQLSSLILLTMSPLQLRFLGLLCMLFPHHSSTLMLYAVVILSQPLLLVVSIRLAPHSEELVLGMETFQKKFLLDWIASALWITFTCKGSRMLQLQELLEEEGKPRKLQTGHLLFGTWCWAVKLPHNELLCNSQYTCRMDWIQ